jgi:hypothetical protein
LPGRSQPAEEQGKSAQDHARQVAGRESSAKKKRSIPRIARTRLVPAGAKKKFAPTIMPKTG